MTDAPTHEKERTMGALQIERTGGFIGATERIRVDDLDADAPSVHVETFGSDGVDHGLMRAHRDELRAARTQLLDDASGAGGEPNGADRYMWTLQLDGDAAPLVFHDPVKNPGARAMVDVAAQLFSVS